MFSDAHGSGVLVRGCGVAVMTMYCISGVLFEVGGMLGRTVGAVPQAARIVASDSNRAGVR